jgi:hypothetical protein
MHRLFGMGSRRRKARLHPLSCRAIGSRRSGAKCRGASEERAVEELGGVSRGLPQSVGSSPARRPHRPAPPAYGVECCQQPLCDVCAAAGQQQEEGRPTTARITPPAAAAPDVLNAGAACAAALALISPFSMRCRSLLSALLQHPPQISRLTTHGEFASGALPPAGQEQPAAPATERARSLQRGAREEARRQHSVERGLISMTLIVAAREARMCRCRRRHAGGQPKKAGAGETGDEAGRQRGRARECARQGACPPAAVPPRFAHSDCAHVWCRCRREPCSAASHPDAAAAAARGRDAARHKQASSR